MYRRTLAALAVSLVAHFAVAWSAAVPAVAQDSKSITFKVKAASERLEMTNNTSRILDFPFKVPKAFVGNSQLLKVQPLSETQIQISAVKPGVTQVNVWDEENSITTIDIMIFGDARELQMLLDTEFPDAQIKVRPLANSVYLAGFVPTAEAVGKIVRLAEDYFPKVINNLRVGGVQQILLKTKVYEVSRTKLRSFGFDYAAQSSNFFISQKASGILNAQSVGQLAGVTGTADTVRFGIVNSDSYFGFLDLLERNELAKLLAEPKLVTTSGRPAQFLVGGQIPIPLAQALGTVTVQFKDFGTQVDFVPMAIGNGMVRLEVRPEVTEVDPSLRDATTGVPGFRTRRADTAVELEAGQTMAIAGLIFQRTDTSKQGVPWLSELPFLGAPFRRTRDQVNELELVIFVTPEFVDAMEPEEVPQCVPGQMTQSPTDTELYWRGYLESPKCCGREGCDGNCKHGTSGRETEIMPREVDMPSRSAQNGRGEVRSASRSKSAKESSGSKKPVMKSASTKKSASKSSSQSDRKGATATISDEPTLIGPLGYDDLK